MKNKAMTGNTINFDRMLSLLPGFPLSRFVSQAGKAFNIQHSALSGRSIWEITAL
jgi:hypothetical protein